MKTCPNCKSNNTRNINDPRFPTIYVCDECVIFFTPGYVAKTWNPEGYEQHHALYFMKQCKDMWV